MRRLVLRLQASHIQRPRKEWQHNLLYSRASRHCCPLLLCPSSRLILSALVVTSAFARSFFTASAARPPVVGTPAAIKTNVAMQTGHISFLLDQPLYSS